MCRSISLLAIAGIVLFGVDAAAEPKTVEEVLQAIQDSVQDVEAWSTDYAMTMNLSGMSMTAKGSTQARDKMVASEMAMNMAGQQFETRSVIDADGILWTEMSMAGQKQVFKMDPDGGGNLNNRIPGLGMMNLGGETAGGGMQNPAQILRSFEGVFDFEYRGIESMDDQDCYTLVGRIKGSAKDVSESLGAGMEMAGAMMNSIKLHVGTKDGITRRFEMLGKNDAPFMTMEYANIALNDAIADSAFVYTPPSGVTPMDLMGR